MTFDREWGRGGQVDIWNCGTYVECMVNERNTNILPLYIYYEEAVTTMHNCGCTGVCNQNPPTLSFLSSTPSLVRPREPRLFHATAIGGSKLRLLRSSRAHAFLTLDIGFARRTFLEAWQALPRRRVWPTPGRLAVISAPTPGTSEK